MQPFRSLEVLDCNVATNCQSKSPGRQSTAMGMISVSGMGSGGINAFTLSALDCVRAANPYPQSPYNFGSKSFKFTTSNGDDLIATYSGTAVLGAATFLLALNGTFEFAGRTGKYKKVRGGGPPGSITADGRRGNGGCQVTWNFRPDRLFLSARNR